MGYHTKYHQVSINHHHVHEFMMYGHETIRLYDPVTLQFTHHEIQCLL